MAASKEIERKISELVEWDELKESIAESAKAAGREGVEAAKIGVNQAAVGIIAIGRVLLGAVGRLFAAIGAMLKSRIQSGPKTFERQIGRIIVYGGVVLVGLRAVGVVEINGIGVSTVVGKLTAELWQLASILS